MKGRGGEGEVESILKYSVTHIRYLSDTCRSS